jgi:hypothetical protein
MHHRGAFGISDSRFNPSGVSSKTQAKTTAGMRPSTSSSKQRLHHPLRRADTFEHHIGDLQQHPADDRVSNGDAHHVAAM